MNYFSLFHVNSPTQSFDWMRLNRESQVIKSNELLKKIIETQE